MRLITLYIEEYGVLRDKRIELSDGINLIQGENESGKSTICAFIKFIFYGHTDSKERELRTSVTSGVSAGYIVFEHSDKKIYRIDRREYDGKTKVTAFCETDGETMKKISVPMGEHFLGIPEKLYTRSIFISQKSAPELDKQSSEAVANLLGSGSESMNVKRAERTLDDMRKELRHLRGRAGLIPEAEDELAEVRKRFKRAVEKKLRVGEINAEIQQISDERERLQNKSSVDKNRCSTSLDGEDIFRLRELSREVEFAQKNTESLESLTKSEPKAPRGFDVYENNPDEGVFTQTFRNMLKEKRKFFVISAAALVLALICFGFSGFSAIFVALGCGFAVFGAFAVFTTTHLSKTFSEFLGELDCRDESEIKEFYARCRSYCETLDTFKEHLRLAEAAHTELEQKKSELAKELDSFGVKSVACAVEKFNAESKTRSDLSEKISSLNARLHELNITLAHLEGESTEDTAELSAIDDALCERLAEYEKRFDAAKLALDALGEAQKSVRQKFIPQISSLGGEYFERLTDGKYQSLSLDSEFGVSCRRNSDTLPLSEERFSGGSYALAWLCLRLALVKKLEDGRLPLILDEPFVYFDDRRLRLAIELLSEISKNGAQVLIFSASDRERRMIDEVYTIYL